MLLDRLRVRAPAICAVLCCAAWSLMTPTASIAQAAGTASAPAAEMTPAERAQRDADKVFKWILILSDKPRKPGGAREERRDDKPAVAAAAASRPAARTPTVARAEPAARPPVSNPAPTTAAAPTSDLPPVAKSPAAELAPPVETALATTAAAATRVAAPSLPAPAPVEEQDEVLRPLVRTEPKFPPNLLRTLTKGQIKVRFTVMPDGSVTEPTVVTTSDSRLRPASLAAVAQWRFAPLRKAQTGVVDLVFDFE